MKKRQYEQDNQYFNTNKTLCNDEDTTMMVNAQP